MARNKPGAPSGAKRAAGKQAAGAQADADAGRATEESDIRFQPDAEKRAISGKAGPFKEGA
jgi:hypothetical protein